MSADEQEEIAKLIGQHFMFCDNIGAMTAREFTGKCRQAAEAIAKRRDHLVANLKNQITDAELALNHWDDGHDSEYWLRYHNTQPE